MVDKKKDKKVAKKAKADWDEKLYQKRISEGVDAEDATKEACK